MTELKRPFQSFHATVKATKSRALHKSVCQHRARSPWQRLENVNKQRFMVVRSRRLVSMASFLEFTFVPFSQSR